MAWKEVHFRLVRSERDNTVLKECVDSFRNVSKFLTSDNFTSNKLNGRLREVISIPSDKLPLPRLASGEIDDTERMFRLWRFYEGDEETNPTLFTLALDRSIRRISDSAENPFVPQRNHWCVSLGISVGNDKGAKEIYTKVKELLKDSTQVELLPNVVFSENVSGDDFGMSCRGFGG